MNDEQRSAAVKDLLEACRRLDRQVTQGRCLARVLLDRAPDEAGRHDDDLIEAMETLLAAELEHWRQQLGLKKDAVSVPETIRDRVQNDLAPGHDQLTELSLMWAYYIDRVDAKPLGKMTPSKWSDRTVTDKIKAGRDRIVELIRRRERLVVTPPASDDQAQHALVEAEPSIVEPAKDDAEYFKDSPGHRENRDAVRSISLKVVLEHRPDELEISRIVINVLIDRAAQGQGFVVNADIDYGFGRVDLLAFAVVPLVVSALAEQLSAQGVETVKELRGVSTPAPWVHESQVATSMQRARMHSPRKEVVKLAAIINDVAQMYVHSPSVSGSDQS